MDTELTLHTILAMREAEARRLVRARAAREGQFALGRPRPRLVRGLLSLLSLRAAPSDGAPETAGRPRRVA